MMALRPQQVAPELLSKISKTLGITSLNQWYYVPHHTATKVIGTRVLNNYGGNLAGFLQSAYPNHHFDEEKLISGFSFEKDQKFLEVIIRQLFPNEEIHTKARKTVGIKNPDTGAYLEIDFWIPSLKLGIEYQDKHHYTYQWYAYDTLENYQKRDDIKKASMSALGYTLITIGYWWDKTPESVAATVKKFRPDLLRDYETKSTEPISSEPPLGYIAASPVIPGVVGMMNPIIPTNDFNPTNWYAGEKYDGVRGVYNPSLNKMFSRSGNELSVVESLLKDIPKILVEGEIMAGRGNYSKTAAVSNHTHHDNVNWPMFRYAIFDIPDVELGDYTQRYPFQRFFNLKYSFIYKYSTITSKLSAHRYIFAQAVFRVLLINKAHLKALVDAIISDAGEGVIAQQDTPYEHGRARGLAKIKVHRDADAQVLRVNKLSCTCKLVSGVSTEINFSGDFDASELKTGDIVSYYHTGYSQAGFPKRAEIYKVRYDITWEELISDDAQYRTTKRRSVNEALGSSSLNAQARNKIGYWNKTTNVRGFCDEFARTAGFDPLVAENWYPVSFRALRNAGGGGLLTAYNSIKKALSYAYPELQFEAEKFRAHQTKAKQKGHWNKPQNVREFFDEFAKTVGFDSLVATNWYSVTHSALQNSGGAGLLIVFGYNREKALSFAYPELKFESGKFRTCEKPKVTNKMGHWNELANVRAFFDKFALTTGFDPLVVENWYPVRVSTLRNAGGGGLLSAHGYQMQNALSFAYPELKFDENFDTHVRGRWNKSENVRMFFDAFAQTYGFDPLVAENWYPVRQRSLRNAGGSGLLSAFDYNVKTALSSAYPELKFDEGRFETHAIQGHWHKAATVRTFFDEFALKKGFSPHVPENWGAVKNSTLQNAGGSALLKAYDYDLKKALLCAYPEMR